MNYVNSKTLQLVFIVLWSNYLEDLRVLEVEYELNKIETGASPCSALKASKRRLSFVLLDFG